MVEILQNFVAFSEYMNFNRSRDDDTEEDTAKKARTAAAAATASAGEQEQAGEFIPLRLDTPVQDPAVQDEGNFYDNY